MLLVADSLGDGFGYEISNPYLGMIGPFDSLTL